MGKYLLSSGIHTGGSKNRSFVRLDIRALERDMEEFCLKFSYRLVKLPRNDYYMLLIIKKFKEITEPFVPKKTGRLRESAHAVSHSRYNYLSYMTKYAQYQYFADDSGWKRTTKGTCSYWMGRAWAKHSVDLCRYAEWLAIHYLDD